MLKLHQIRKDHSKSFKINDFFFPALQLQFSFLFFFFWIKFFPYMLLLKYEGLVLQPAVISPPSNWYNPMKKVLNNEAGNRAGQRRRTGQGPFRSENGAGPFSAGPSVTGACLLESKGTWMLWQEMFIGNQGLQGGVLRISN